MSLEVTTIDILSVIKYHNECVKLDSLVNNTFLKEERFWLICIKLSELWFERRKLRPPGSNKGAQIVHGRKGALQQRIEEWNPG